LRLRTGPPRGKIDIARARLRQKQIPMSTQIESPPTTIPTAGLIAGDGNVVVRAHSPRILASITALVWLVPLLLLAIAAWQNWRTEIEETDNEIQNVLTVLAEQTEQVFQGQTVLLEWIDRRTKGWTWDDIERSAELHDFITGLDKGSDYIDSVFLVDGDGRVRMTEHRFPMRSSLKYAGDREYFVGAKNGTPDAIHVGRLEQGRWSGQLAFRVARRRSSADGSFDGIIAARLSPKYFEDFFAKIIKTTAGAITISRSDGVVLARTPAIPRGAPQPDGEPYSDMTTFRSTESVIFTSTLDGVERFGAVRKLRNYPVFVSYAIDMHAIRKEWMERLTPFAIVAFSSSLILILLSLYVQRIARGERIAQQAWQDEVTDRLRREAQVRQALKMEALGRLAGGVAHHFNNLLPAMSGLLEMTRAEVPADSSAAKRLGRMIGAVDQGRDLVRQILTFSHRDIARRDRLRVSALIDDALALAQGNMPRNISLRLERNHDGELVGDPSQLRDVLLNLISNAVYAIGARGGTITISMEILFVDGEAAERLAVRAGHFARIDCSDDGVGMSEDVQEHAFEPFFTTKPKGEGSGLGLAIVHGVIVGHGGAIEVQSSPSTGSRFSIYLPVLRSD
jgi:signal transduction histidine kinase